MERINHADITVVFSTSDHLPVLLKLADKTPQVKLLVSMDEILPEVKNVLIQWGGKIGIKVMELSERASHISELEAALADTVSSGGIWQGQSHRSNSGHPRFGVFHMLYLCAFQCL